MTDYVHVLWHFTIGADEAFDEDGDMKMIGIYTTKQRAAAAVARLRDKPGFRDWPEGFRIFGNRLDEDSWEEGFIPASEA